MSLNFPFTDFFSDVFEFTRDDVDYTIYVIEGQYDNFPWGVTVYPGNTYEVDVFYGSGSLPDGAVQFPAFDYYNPES